MVKEFFKSIKYLVFPNLCLACLKEPAGGEDLFCINCVYNLSISEMHLTKENQFTNRLIGIEGIETGAAYYLFYEGGAVGEILHKIKYTGRKDIAVVLGKVYGEKLVDSKYFQNIDYLVPVPLHRNRFRKRGFNQSEELCKGLSEGMEVEVETNNLIRIKDTPTQTKLSKSERQKNLKGAFVVSNPERLEGKHVLLVDDVLTTGATIEMCTNVLRKINGIKISIVTLAIRVYQ